MISDAEHHVPCCLERFRPQSIGEEHVFALRQPNIDKVYANMLYF